MVDIEKVIKDLDELYRMIYQSNVGGETLGSLHDALALLKEYAVIKETISNEIHGMAKMFRRTEDNGWIERCDRRARQSLSD